MLIVRLIADMPDWETRLSALKAQLGAESIPIASVERHDWGAPVLELRLESSAPLAVNAILDQHFSSADRLVSAQEIAVPQVFVSDMDSTMIGQECIDELADYAGLKTQIAAITERAMQGELDFEAALRERVALLAGLEESAIGRCLAERIRPNRGARTLVQTLKHKGARTVLVTGGFHHFADTVAAQLGFDRVVGNRLEVKGGVLTGKLEGPVSDGQTKARVLREEVAGLGVGAVSLGIGDGANDIDMITSSTYGFAYCARPAARAAAQGRLESGDLANVLTLLGIAREDFAGS